MRRLNTIDSICKRRSRTIVTVALVAGTLALVGCGDSTKRSLGLTKSVPDEFAVVSRAPLSRPPDYGLRPPRPGAESPSRVTPTQEAKQTLFGSEAAAGTAATANRQDRPAGSPSAAPRTAVNTTTPGESALLSKAGATSVDPNIRAEIDRESAVLAQADQNFIQELLDYTPDRAEVVDAAGEAKRLRENEALGKPVTEGQTPTIERKSRGLLEGIF